MGKTCSDKLTQKLRIEIKAPALFRCPISLEIMQSPVSLCTGVTYDRASIQRWLDAGNTTCPATMLPLPSTDLIPNLTLRRLINLWSAAKLCNDAYTPADIVRDLDNFKLGDFFMDPDVDDSVKNGFISLPDFARNVVQLVLDKTHGNELNLKAIEILELILDSNWIDDKSREIIVSALYDELDSVVNFVVRVLKDEGSKSGMKRVCIRVLNILLSSSRSQIMFSSKLDDLVCEVIPLVSNHSIIDDGLTCLLHLIHSKQALKLMVHYNLVQVSLKVLSVVTSKNAEKAIMVLEAAANCAAGRASINEVVEECVEIVMGWMMKIGKGGREAAIGLLWNMCFNNKNGAGLDRKAKDSVALVKGGMAKILVVMQSDCGMMVRKMARDLLRVFKVDAKGLIAGYDTKTTHIMPF